MPWASANLAEPARTYPSSHAQNPIGILFGVQTSSRARSGEPYRRPYSKPTRGIRQGLQRTQVCREPPAVGFSSPAHWASLRFNDLVQFVWNRACRAAKGIKHCRYKMVYHPAGNSTTIQPPWPSRWPPARNWEAGSWCGTSMAVISPPMAGCWC
jgi:hypothetical protein